VPFTAAALAPDVPVNAKPAATSIAKKIVRIVLSPRFITPAKS
jgi:hypothetical protein